MPSTTKQPKKLVREISYPAFQKWNVVVAILLALQGILILVLGHRHSYPVTTSYLTTDPLATTVAGHPVLAEATRHLFDISIVYLVALFLFIPAFAYGLLATIYRRQYEKGLGEGINRVRWINYGLSAGFILITIGLLSGIDDLSSLIMIFVLSLIANLFGLLMEVHNQTTKKTNWLSYIGAGLASVVPWVVLLIYMIGANAFGSGQLPTFLYWIYITVLIFFAAFGLTMFLHYRKVGKWTDYLYSEKSYLVLSFVVKSLLVWQIFAGVLKS